MASDLIRRDFLRAGLPLLAGRQAAAVPPFRQVRVDAGERAGTIRSLQQVNCGPAHSRPGVPDISRQYRDLRIDSVRTHDFYGPTDIDAFRPGRPWDRIIFPRWEADATAEASYNFGPSDPLIRAIVDCGASVYYRLGRSWNAVADPPRDFGKFARICERVVRHYNEGWANGYRYNIRYWEVWNEPDGRFWNGTPEQFWKLYEATARVLKRHDPNLKVGACGVTGRGSTRPGPYREGLIRYCADRRVPLDFYSWHYYAARTHDPYPPVRMAREIRRILDGNGFEKAESHMNEWNINPGIGGRNILDTMVNGAFTASVLIYLQDAPVEMAHYYRGDAGHPMGLFRRDGSYKKRAYAYKAMARMLDAPQRVAAAGGDTSGFGVLAGRSADGRKVQVLISNYEIRPPGAGAPLQRYRNNRGYALEVRNLPWGKAPFSVKRYRVTEDEDFRLVSEAPAKDGVLKLAQQLPPPAFELIVLEANR